MAVTTEMIKALREETGAGVLDCKKALEVSGGDFDRAVAFLREKGLAAAAKKASRDARDGLISLHVDGAGQSGVILEVNCETDFVARTEDFQAFVKALLDQVRESPGVHDVPTLLEQPYALDRSITVGQRLTNLVAKIGENIMIARFARVQRSGPGLVEGYLHPGSRIGVLLSVGVGSPDVAASAAFRELVHDLALQVAAAAPRYVGPADIPADVLADQRNQFMAQVAGENKPEAIKERIVTGKLEKWYEGVCLVRQAFVKDDSLRVGELVEQKSKQWNAPITIERFVRYELGAE